MGRDLHEVNRSKAIEYHLPCPVCPSSDAYTIYDDGHGHCFSCGETIQPEKEKEVEEDLEQEVKFEVRSFRSIARTSAEFYGVETKIVGGKEIERGFPFGDNAVKIKDIQDKKKQKTIGEFQKAGLFGQDRFDKGSKEAILITEGEEDAIAAYEMLRYKFAVVSLKTGALSTKDLSRRDIWEYVNSFDKIYICFDNDAPGKSATRALAGIFDFRKTYHVQLSRHKDANDYLKAQEAEDFEKTVRAAKRYAPDNIISAFSDIEKALDESTEEMLAEYPFPELQDMTYGMHEGEIIVVKAPEGVGKTEFLRALEYHILKTTGHPLGIIHLEEMNSTTIRAIAGYELRRPATLPDHVSGLSKQDIVRGYKAAVGDDESRVHIHSSFDVEDEESFYGSIRFLVSSAGCRIICFDHISWLATGNGGDDDERKKLDRISQRLKLMAKELKFCLLEISHVNDEGQTRGSRNISKVANTVLSLSRDLKAGDNVTAFLLEKVRLGGRTGPAGYAYFDRETGRLEAEKPDPVLEEDE